MHLFDLNEWKILLSPRRMYVIVKCFVRFRLYCLRTESSFIDACYQILCRDMEPFKLNQRRPTDRVIVIFIVCNMVIPFDAYLLCVLFQVRVHSHGYLT